MKPLFKGKIQNFFDEVGVGGEFNLEREWEGVVEGNKFPAEKHAWNTNKETKRHTER